MPSLIAWAACTLARRATRINWQLPLTAGDRHTCRQPDPILNTYCARPAHHAGPHDDTLGCIWYPHGARSCGVPDLTTIDDPTFDDGEHTNPPHGDAGRITIHGEPAA